MQNSADETEQGKGELTIGIGRDQVERPPGVESSV